MKVTRIVSVAIVVLLAAVTAVAKQAEPLNAQRIAEIATKLPQTPAGPGRPISDRVFWGTLYRNPAFQGQVAAADKLAATPIAPISDELFLEYSKTGNRRNFEGVAFERRNRLPVLVLAECLTNSGRYVSAINKLIDALCAEKTWVLPAHDKQLTNFNGTEITIDLYSSELAWELAMVDYLLGDRLNPATRERMRAEIQKRIIVPFQDMIRGKRELDTWFLRTNNWNSVCLAGVTGTALIALPGQEDRAEIVAAAEHYSKNFLAGFTSDGYCSEGVGYWNYGYGNYGLLAETVRIATGGAVDLFKVGAAFEPAAYGARITIINGQIPAYADCSVKARPDGTLLWLLNKVYGWGVAEYATLNVPVTLANLSSAMVYQAAMQDGFAPIKGAEVSGDSQIRTVFEEAGIYISRPAAKGGPAGFAASFKGGSNNEQHNHNDVGSYVVIVGESALLLDPGSEIYTARTFGPNRYDSKMLNSYGHAVPVVAGELQRQGRRTKGKVVSKSFTDEADKVVMDMKSAYGVKSVKELTRTFEYRRGQGGSFTISDHVEFRQPQKFETAMISLGEFSRSADGSAIIVTDGKTSARVHIHCSAPFEFAPEVIKENAVVEPRRLGIRLKEPTTSATITMIVSPNTGQ